MQKDVLYLDVGGAITSARAVALSGDGFTSISHAFCPSPPWTGGDLTAAIPPALSTMRYRMGETGPSYDPGKIVVTVSAGGEPRTVCAGVVRGISGESAKRAALSAGATVADLISVDDGRQDFERISDLRRQEIAMVVMAGGVDEEILKSGTHQLINIAKVIANGLPPRRGDGRKVPVVYAASADGREEVTKILQDTADIIWADNVRPTLEVETLESARGAVVDAFVDSVRRDARFRGLGRLGSPETWPAGYAIGVAVEDYHKRTGENVLVISLDGDSVQVFSGIRGIFTRTVTPVSRVLHKNLRRHLPTQQLMNSSEDTLGNWKLRPGTLPRTWDELAVFLAIYKEAVREAMTDHKASAIELRGVHRQRTISETFQVGVSGGDTLVRMETIGKVVLTGYLSRLLSHASLMSLIADAADPSGITEVMVDPNDSLAVAGSISKLGTAVEFESHLKPVGLLVSPGRNEERVGPKRAFIGATDPMEALPVEPDGVSVESVEHVPGLQVVVNPPNNRVDFGEGEGRKARRGVPPGFSSIYLDGRSKRARTEATAKDVQRWYRGMKVFPNDVISGWEGGRQ